MALRFLSFSARFFDRLSTFMRRWLHSIREHSIPLYYDYIEGLWGEYVAARRNWQQPLSRTDEIWLSLPWGINLLWGISRLTFDQVRRIVQLFFANLSSDDPQAMTDDRDWQLDVNLIYDNAEALIAGLCVGLKTEEFAWIRRTVERCQAWLKQRFGSEQE
jgi:hypothetical protein